MRLRGRFGVLCAISCLPSAVPAHAQFLTDVTITNPNAAPVTQLLTLSDLTATHAFAVGGQNTVLNGAYNGLNSGLLATITFNHQSVSLVSPIDSTVVTVNGFGTVKTFQAGTRVASLQDAVNYYLNGVNSYINSPTSPSNAAVGNPESLVGRMVSRDFMMETGIGDFDQTGLAGGEPSPGQAVARTPNALTVGDGYSYASAGGVSISSVTIPIDYNYYFSNPLYSVAIDVPLTYLTVGGANVAQGSVGARFKFPVMDNWSLSVSGRIGAVGSQDLLLGDIAYSGVLGSQYLIFAGDYRIIIGNAVGFINTSPFRVGEYTSGPSRLNVPLINGVSVEGSLPFTVFDKATSYEAYVVDTYFAGQPVGIQHYDEIGLNVGTRRRVGDQSWDTARLGVAYTVGKSFNEFSLRATYRF